MNSQLQKNDNGTVTITGEIAWDDVAGFREAAIKELQDRVEIDGFRKGHVPEDVLIKKVGDMGLFQEMAHHALMQAYPLAIQEHSIDAIGRPDIQLTKIAENNPLEFSITSAIMPVITIKDYKKIASKIVKDAEKPELPESEVEEALMQLRKMRKQSEIAKEAEDPQKVPSINDIEEKDLPELDDEYVQGLGEFKDFADFEKQLRENLLKEKEGRIFEKTRGAIVDALVEADEATMPDMLVEFEIDKIMAQMQHDMAMSGMAFEDYLKHSGKKVEEIREDVRPEATKRTHMQMIIDHIAVAEELKADEAKVKEEMEKITKMYADHKDFNEDRAKVYVESMLLNQAVFEFLEDK